MKTFPCLSRLLLAGSLLGQVAAAPMGSAFTYQGQLTTGDNPANGLYDFSFTLFDSPSAGQQVGASFTTNALPVTNGLFATIVDCGTNVFDGSARWLAISVKTNGAATYFLLTPRDPLTPLPYALFAGNAASALSALAASSVAAQAVTTAGLQDAAVTAAKISAGQVVKSLNGLTDAVTLSAGNNITLTPSGNSLQISANATAGAGWLLTGNAGAGPPSFVGTTDPQPLDLVVDGRRAFHLEPSDPSANEVNVVGGSASNTVSAGISGATIGGGGSFYAYYDSGLGQWITNDQRNAVSADYATLLGGLANNMQARDAVLAGGNGNAVQANAAVAFLGGGVGNSVAGLGGAVIGGVDNSAAGQVATVGGGLDNAASGAAAFVGGGGYDGFVAIGNLASGPGSVVVGGTQNTASGSRSTVGGGHDNAAINWYATVPGGAWNRAGGMGSFAAGQTAKVAHDGTFIWGDTSTLDDMASTAPNQFLIRAAGGVGIGTASPTTTLEVAGTTTATGFQGQGMLLWQLVTGTAQQAQPNCGYLVNNPPQVTVTLPDSPAIGDIVALSGAGAGGWKIAQGAGQQIVVASLGQGLPTGTWNQYTNSKVLDLNAVASSADGSKLVAVGDWSAFTSTDSGATWTIMPSPFWNPPVIDNFAISVASSADGSKLVATTTTMTYDPGSQIYTSTDSGATWTPRQPLHFGYNRVACSADGAKLVVTQDGVGYFYSSADSGATWTQSSAPPGLIWTALTSSADGTKLAAGTENGGGWFSGTWGIYTSSDSGATWLPQTNAPLTCSGLASSTDGTKLVAASYRDMIYTSSDSGNTWSSCPNAGVRQWSSVACSADGTKLAATDEGGPNGGGGQIYVSADSGATWTAVESDLVWTGIASSADGTKLVACAWDYGETYGGLSGIYTSSGPGTAGVTTAGPAGYLIGSAGAAIELQYIGNNQFLSLSHEGSLTAH